MEDQPPVSPEPTADVTQPVAPEQPEPKLGKEELKDLLSELIEEVKSEKLTEELVQKLQDELNTAKNDFLVAVKNVEDAISKVVGKNNTPSPHPQ